MGKREVEREKDREVEEGGLFVIVAMFPSATWESKNQYSSTSGECAREEEKGFYALQD